MLISFDGVGGERLAKMLEEGKLPSGGFRRLADRGFFARRSRPPNPSLTAVSHVTHVTGALPEKTGVVANEMLDFSKPFATRLSGFDAPIRAETLWQSARRQGRRVGILLYPGGDGATPGRSGDFGMSWVYVPLAPSRLATLGAADWAPAGPAAAPSFSPARSHRLALPPTAHAATLVALDATDDGRTNYDRLRVETETGASLEVRPGEWFPIEASGESVRSGAWCKLIELASDLSKTVVYVGSLEGARAYPEKFRRGLEERAGFWPGKPDIPLLGASSPWPEGYYEQAGRLTEYVTRAVLYAVERDDWDLLLIYEPQVDEVSHEYFLTEPKQRGYSPERAARFAAYVEGSYAMADRSLDRIERALRPTDAIFVTSDHGMVPLSAAVYPNEILRQAGFLRTGVKDEIDPGSQAAAMAGSGVANIYLNPAAAEKNLLERVENAMRSFRIGGESPWDRVVRRADAGPLGLDAPESGDLILLARPGISVSMRIEAGRTSGAPASYGGHGYRNVYPPLDATFLAAGPGIARERVEEFPSWRIASFVSRVLGIAPPRDATP